MSTSTVASTAGLDAWLHESRSLSAGLAAARRRLGHGGNVDLAPFVTRVGAASVALSKAPNDQIAATKTALADLTDELERLWAELGTARAALGNEILDLDRARRTRRAYGRSPGHP